jgi:beta-glucuronidase
MRVRLTGMHEKGSNYQPQIHDENYAAAYLETRLDSRGLIDTAGRETESLNGTWNFGADWYDTCLRSRWFAEQERDGSGRPLPMDYDWDSWEPMIVPSCWNLQRAELHYFEGSGVYTRTFPYVSRRDGERAFLRFDGAHYRTTVFVNRTCLGTHSGGSTPFCAEITGAVRPDNRIVVVVEARRRHDRVPEENTDWFNYGGIFRDVLLLRTPPVFIRDWFLRLVPDGRFQAIALDLRVEGADTAEARLRIPELGVDIPAPVRNGTASVRVDARPGLWSPGSPRLYDVELECGQDRVRDRVGFREIRVQGQDIILNGDPYFLKGICVHEDHALTGRTTSEETIRSTIADVKRLNGNYIRLAHYPHDGRFARIADEEGVLLWAEVPVYWAIDFANRAVLADAENQLSELVLRDRNRASVGIWSVGNENPDTDDRLSFMSRLVDVARSLDDTRPVSAACLVDHDTLAIRDRLAEFLDIIGINEYYGWYDPDFEKLARVLANSRPGKPVVVCEFGADARAGFRGGADELFSEDMQARIYERQLETLSACPYVKGLSPWILYDFRSPRRLNRHQDGFNRKGLIDADRITVKKAFAVLQDFYAHGVKGRSV